MNQQFRCGHCRRVINLTIRPADPTKALPIFCSTSNQTVELHRLSRDGAKEQYCCTRFLRPALSAAEIELIREVASDFRALSLTEIARSDVTIREVLNRIALAQGDALWVSYRCVDSGGCWTSV